MGKWIMSFTDLGRSAVVLHEVHIRQAASTIVAGEHGLVDKLCTAEAALCLCTLGWAGRLLVAGVP